MGAKFPEADGERPRADAGAGRAGGAARVARRCVRSVGPRRKDPELVQQARVTAEKYMSSPDSVGCGTGEQSVDRGGAEWEYSLYEEYVQHLKSAKTPEEYYNYLLALGAFPEPQLAKKTFDLVPSDQVKNRDMFALASVLQNYETQTAAW